MLSEDRGQQSDVKTRIDEDLKHFGAVKKMYNVRNAIFAVNMNFF